MKFFSNLGWFDLLAVVFGMTIGAAATHVYDTAQIEITKANLAGVKAQHSDQQAQATQAALVRLQEATQRANALQTTLDATEQRLATTKTELSNEIQKSTTGRACLNGRTVGLLNRATTGSEPATLSSATSGPTEASTGFATDTDIATWINSATAQYNTCRARLDALIDWHMSIPEKGVQHD